MKTCENCSGCRNDFYNDKNPYGVKRCWSLDKAKMVTRFKLSVHTPMWFREAYKKVRVPNCYHSQGYVYCKEIQASARTRAEREAITAREKMEATT